MQRAGETGEPMASDVRQWIAALRSSHDQLVETVGALGADQVDGPSYCADWTVAQVLSHLGSGAEIALANLEASLSGEPAPSRDDYVAIWDRWNAKTPAAMAADALVADEDHVGRLERLSEAQLEGLSMEFMGRTLDAVGIVGLRLGEHAVHTWDVAVTRDPAAAVAPEAMALLVDVLPPRAGLFARGDKPAAIPVELAVDTTGPERHYLLSIGDEVSLSTDTGNPKGRLSIPAEALFRLCYGRLDPEHTPAATRIEGPVSLAELQAMFPGF